MKGAKISWLQDFAPEIEAPGGTTYARKLATMKFSYFPIKNEF